MAEKGAISDKEKGEMWGLMNRNRDAIADQHTRLSMVEQTTDTIQDQFQTLVGQISEKHAKTESLMTDTNDKMTILATDYHKRVGVKEFFIRWCIPVASLFIAVAAIVYSTSG